LAEGKEGGKGKTEERRKRKEAKEQHRLNHEL
jgi:hypothetical protein